MKQLLTSIQILEETIAKYHARNGTYNFHYSHFDLMSWRVWLKEYGLSQEDWDRMDVEDYMVRISWSDNSNSYDDYCVLLQDILDWAEKEDKK